jgi:hypothetical protein
LVFVEYGVIGLRKGIALLLVLVMSIGTISSAVGSTDVSLSNGIAEIEPRSDTSIGSQESVDTEDPMMDYLQANHGPGPGSTVWTLYGPTPSSFTRTP